MSLTKVITTTQTLFIVYTAKKKKKEGLKLSSADDDDDDDDETDDPVLPPAGPTTTGSFTVSRLDATTVDVYKGCNGVIVMVDPTKKWTFDYAQRVIGGVPKDLDVLLLVIHVP